MTVEKLIEELKYWQEKGFTEIRGTMFAEVPNDCQGVLLTAKSDDEWLDYKETY